MQIRRWFLGFLVLTCVVISSPACGKEPKQKLVLLKPETCAKGDRSLLGMLPDQWRPYYDFVKICPLPHNSDFSVAIVSIWVLDFYNAKFPAGSPRIWEQFPLPVMIDGHGKIIGELPEHYPDDPPRELEIYYTKDKSAPPAIKVRVFNPAVDGDYSYSLITWNQQLGRYELKDKVLKYAK